MKENKEKQSDICKCGHNRMSHLASCFVKTNKIPCKCRKFEKKEVEETK
jgi:hypothetical protein